MLRGMKYTEASHTAPLVNPNNIIIAPLHNVRTLVIGCCMYDCNMPGGNPSAQVAVESGRRCASATVAQGRHTPSAAPVVPRQQHPQPHHRGQRVHPLVGAAVARPLDLRPGGGAGGGRTSSWLPADQVKVDC